MQSRRRECGNNDVALSGFGLVEHSLTFSGVVVLVTKDAKARIRVPAPTYLTRHRLVDTQPESRAWLRA